MPNLTEEDINSEVAIFRSQDLLEKVVAACDLQKIDTNSRWERLISALKDSEPTDEQTAIRVAAAKLANDLRVDPVKKSYIISVNYAAGTPQFAARVLNTLGSLYLEKHAAVHRPNDAFGFFDRETQRYRQILEDADKRLAAFNLKEGVVASSAKRSIHAKARGVRAEHASNASGHSFDRRTHSFLRSSITQNAAAHNHSTP